MKHNLISCLFLAKSYNNRKVWVEAQELFISMLFY